MYPRYQVILVAEDVEYVLSEWRTPEEANKDADRLAPNYGEGQQLVVRLRSGGF